MNCEIVRQRMMSASSPGRAPGNVRAHLAYCQDCRDWHEHLETLEYHVPYLPVPRSGGKARLIHRILNDKPEPVQTAPQVSQPGPERPFSEPLILSYVHLLASPRMVAGMAAVLLLVLSVLLVRS